MEMSSRLRMSDLTSKQLGAVKVEIGAKVLLAISRPFERSQQETSELIQQYNRRCK